MSRATVIAAAAGGLAALIAQRLYRRITIMRLPASVAIPGCGEVAVSTQRSGGNLHVTLNWNKVFGAIPYKKMPFCSAVMTDDGTIYVSGAIGTAAPLDANSRPKIVAGGPKAKMIRVMEIIEACLQACGASIESITMAHCYLVDNTPSRFAEMNNGYLEFMGERPLPARITVGCSALALGSCVEVDVIAKRS